MVALSDLLAWVANRVGSEDEGFWGLLRQLVCAVAFAIEHGDAVSTVPGDSYYQDRRLLPKPTLRG